MKFLIWHIANGFAIERIIGGVSTFCGADRVWWNVLDCAGLMGFRTKLGAEWYVSEWTVEVLDGPASYK